MRLTGLLRGMTVFTGATYNAFLHQIGYCRYQSFDTVSRNTSKGPPLFTDGRITIGVGLSQVNMLERIGCGACLNITSVSGMPVWNSDLTGYVNDSNAMIPFLAMVFDMCTDPVCTRDWIDFDVYIDTLPVQRGNPHDVTWELVRCPLYGNELPEFLMCTDKSCHEGDAEGRSVGDVIGSDLVFWSITIRNTAFPVVAVRANGTPLRKSNAWEWNYGNSPWDVRSGLDIEFTDYAGEVYTYQTTPPHPDSPTAPGYRGGVFLDILGSGKNR
jgi:hypothetical protein